MRAISKWLASVVIATVLLASAIGYASAQPPLDVSVGSGSGQPGDSGIPIPVSLDCSGTSPIASLQFHLNYDANTLIGPAVTPGPASASKIVESQSFSGYERIIIYGGRSLMPCGTLVNVSFNVLAAAPSGQTGLTLSNYIFSNPDATPMPASINNGIFQVITPTPTSTNTPTPSNTPTPTNTPIPPTPTNSATAGPSPTPSLTLTPSLTPTPSNTSPPTSTSTPGPSPTASNTPSGTLTPSPTGSMTATSRATTSRTPSSEGAGEGLELEGAAAATGTALAKFEAAVAATSTALAEEAAARPTDQIVDTGPSTSLLLRPEVLVAFGLLLLAIVLGGGLGYLIWRRQRAE